MKVLHITPSIARAYGGPTYSLAGYGAASSGEGIEISIAGPAPSIGDKWLAEMLPQAQIYVFRTYGRGAFLASTDLHAWLRRNGSRFDVIHIHGLLNPVSSLAARACIRHGWPVVIRPFGTLSKYTYAHRRGALKQAYRWLLDRPNLERVSAVHFTTDVEKAESAWQKVEWGERAHVIPPPWLDGPTKGTGRAKTEPRIVLFLARLHPVKRLELLLDAWPKVQARVPDARLIIAGEGDAGYTRELKARASALEPSVSFAGFVDGVAKQTLLHEAHVFVLPSLHENFGISVLEALAAGLPVVLSPEVQLSSFVTEHSLGIVTEGSSGAIADAVVGALEDRVLRERCRKQGPSLVARYFSLRTIGEQLAAMYCFASSHPPA